MIARASCFLAAVCLLGVVLTPAPAQLKREDYRQFLKPPDTVQEYFKAIQFEVEFGQFKLAAFYLKALLAKNPGEEDLVKLEESEGMASFLKLRLIKWSEDPKEQAEIIKEVEELIDLTTASVKRHLSNPDRINKLIRLVQATPHERMYAVKELRRSGPFAMVPLINALAAATDAKDTVSILQVMPYLTRDTVPAILAGLDIQNPIIQAGLIDALRKREDFWALVRRPETDPTPYFYYLAESPRVDEAVQKKARTALSHLLEVHPDKLPKARVELTRAAEKFYNKQMPFADPKNVRVYSWTGKDLLEVTLPANLAEEYYGLRFSKQALEIDPFYEPAQTVFLSLAVANGVERAGLDQPVAKALPQLRQLLATINPDIIVTTLERALNEKRRSVVLGCVRALGDLAEVRAAKPKSQGVPPLVRALNYPDRRVQVAAADALLKIPGPPPVQAQGRLIEVLRRAVASDPISKVLVVDHNIDRAREVAAALKDAGYDPVVAQTGKQALAILKEAADIDLVLLDYEVADPQLREMLVQLRSDLDTAMLPILVTVPPTPEGRRDPIPVIPLTRLAQNYRNVQIVQATNDPDMLKKIIPPRLEESLGQPFTEDERKAMALESMAWLRRLATGEVAGYDVRNAESAILKVLRSDDLGVLAAEAAGRLPSRSAQRELATVILDQNIKQEVRVAAAFHLVRSIQINSLVLGATLSRALEELYQKTPDEALKNNLSLVVGAMRPDAVKTAQRIQGYSPIGGGAAPAPQPKVIELKKEEMKKEEKEK